MGLLEVPRSAAAERQAVEPQADAPSVLRAGAEPPPPDEEAARRPPTSAAGGTGAAAQNAYIERFNRTFRSEVLSAYLFEDLDQVRQIAWQWMIEYNEVRPHDALGKIPPLAFREKVEAGNSSYELSA